MMNERLLQFIWQFKYFNFLQLTDVAENALEIIHPGTFNQHQGPDFLNARIRIGDTIWVGNIELHVRASDWHRHLHSSDKNYHNIILHVVWENDVPIEEVVSTIILKDRVPKLLLKQYEQWMTETSFIPCSKSIDQLNNINWIAWKERLLIERLESKSKDIYLRLETLNYHWEEVFWITLARTMGYSINADAFEEIAGSIPLNILSKHKNQIHQLEALLLGQAGLLGGVFNEHYPAMLQKEYLFLSKKYGLRPIKQSVHFLRMRPSNFPTVRLAQLAALIHVSQHLFSTVKEATDIKEVTKLFSITANDYWHYHYLFEEEAEYKKKALGKQMTHNILINVIVPMLFTYGQYHSDQQLKDKVIKWLLDIPAEKNTIINSFAAIGIPSANSFDSQSLLQLKKKYCDQKRCLDCAIGNSILKKTKH